MLRLMATASSSRPELLSALGHIIITTEGAAALHLRSAYRALLGQPVGIEGTIGKTVVADVAQKVGDFALDLMLCCRAAVTLST